MSNKTVIALCITVIICLTLITNCEMHTAPMQQNGLMEANRSLDAQNRILIDKLKQFKLQEAK